MDSCCGAALPAIAITLAIFAAVQIVMPTIVRAHLIAPVQIATTITASNLTGLQVRGNPETGLPTGPVRHITIKAGAPGDWVLSNRTVDADGQAREARPTRSACVPRMFRTSHER